MTFVTPSLLAGVLLIGIPVALHLIMRRQPQRVQFPALQLLHGRHEANRRRLRLRHLLLLLLRCAVIALLALALARPSLQGSGMLGGGQGPVAAALVFDASPRLEYREQNARRLEAAQQLALWLTGQMPADSELVIFDTSRRITAPAADLLVARRQIERLATSPIVRPLPDVLLDALRALSQSKLERKEMYVFTDLSKAGWKTADGDRLADELSKTPQARLYIVDVGALGPRDDGLGDLELSSQVLSIDDVLRLGVDLQRIGADGSPAIDGATSPRTVELLVLGDSGELEKRGQRTLAAGDDGDVRAEFQLRFSQPGVHQGVVRIAGADALPGDDQRYFTVDVQRPPKVLIAASEPHHAGYLKEVISPRELPGGAGGGFIADSTVIPISALEEQSLADVAVVCLLDPPPLAAPLWQKLADYVRQGGGLGIFLGRRANPVQAMNEPAAQEVLPGELKRRWSEPTFLAPDNFQHPILAKFQPVRSQVPWQAFPVYKYWQIDEPSPGVEVVLRYATGHPAMLEEPLGQGRIITMTTPISDPAYLPDRWNLLPTGPEPWPYVLLASETVAHLARGGQVTLNYQPGETAHIPLPRESRFDFIALLQPDGRNLRQTQDPTENAAVIRATERLGNYRIRAGGVQGGLDRGFSVNLPAWQSQLDRVDVARLDELLGKDRYKIARDKKEIDRDVNVGRVGTELFPYVVFLLALVLLAEHLLSNRFYRDAA